MAARAIASLLPSKHSYTTMKLALPHALSNILDFSLKKTLSTSKICLQGQLTSVKRLDTTTCHCSAMRYVELSQKSRLRENCTNTDFDYFVFARPKVVSKFLLESVLIAVGDWKYL